MEFDKGFMSDSMFGKTVSELTAERQKKNMDIISDILSGARAEKKSELAATVGAPLGIMFAKWAKSKMGDGEDSVLESARGVNEQETAFRNLLKTLDYSKPDELEKVADIYTANGEEEKALRYRGLKKQAEASQYDDAVLSTISPEKIKKQLDLATDLGDVSQISYFAKLLARKQKQIASQTAETQENFITKQGPEDAGQAGGDAKQAGREAKQAGRDAGRTIGVMTENAELKDKKKRKDEEFKLKAGRDNVVFYND
jgi:hypothetical protein